jgi:hypothetical protein
LPSVSPLYIGDRANRGTGRLSAAHQRRGGADQVEVAANRGGNGAYRGEVGRILAGASWRGEVGHILAAASWQAHPGGRS